MGNDMKQADTENMRCMSRMRYRSPTENAVYAMAALSKADQKLAVDLFNSIFSTGRGSVRTTISIKIEGYPEHEI